LTSCVILPSSRTRLWNGRRVRSHTSISNSHYMALLHPCAVCVHRGVSTTALASNPHWPGPAVVGVEEVLSACPPRPCRGRQRDAQARTGYAKETENRQHAEPCAVRRSDLIPAEQGRPQREIPGGRRRSAIRRFIAFGILLGQLRYRVAITAIIAASALAAWGPSAQIAVAGPSNAIPAARSSQESPGDGSVRTAGESLGAASDATSDSSPPSSESTDAVGEPQGDPGEGGEATAAERATPTSRGGTRSVEPSPADKPDGLSAGDRVASIAQQYLGFPYVWGGSSPRTGFDCSGFDGYVYREAGIPLPAHDLWGQLNAGPRIAIEDLRPGDLVFFQNTYKWGLSHGGIYIGNRQFIHSVEEGVGVQISSLDDGYWASRFVAGSRPWASIRGPAP